MSSAAFSGSKRGELFELKDELNSQSNSTRKEAVRKTIAAMTVGRDVSGLFTDVLNCMQNTNIEIKKLVYLYIVNYAQTKPDLAILAVNSFVRDSEDPNPLLRALAIRTMACIRVDKIIEYLLEPLQRTLQDKDPYVRKTAAVCVAKLYAMNPALVEDQGFLNSLVGLLSDGNPMVVANAVASLMDIAETRPDIFHIDAQLVMKLLHAINECNEWGQIFLLDALAEYEVRNSEEADAIVERVTSRLQHANGGVVISATRLIVINSNKMSSEEKRDAALHKLTAPLVTLLSAHGEFQYLALRTMRTITEKHPELFRQDVRMFFCKYNDPLYVKQEKLELLVAIADESNVAAVLQEIKEYAAEVDIDFVRKSIDCIGRIALKLETSASRCAEALLALLKSGHESIVEPCVVVVRNIVRCYRESYDGMVRYICENVEYLGDPDARAAMVWLIGEYSADLPNAVELLSGYMETFGEEAMNVQFHLLSAGVKTFLNRGSEAHELVQRALRYCTEETFSIQLREKGHIYGRLLACGPEVAQRVIMAETPSVVDTRGDIEPELLDNVIQNLGRLNALLLRKDSEIVAPATALMSEDGQGNMQSGTGEDLLALDNGPPPVANKSNPSDVLGLGDLMGALPAPGGSSAASKTQSSSILDDILGPSSALPAPAPVPALPAAPQMSALPAPTGGDDLLSQLGIGASAPVAAAPVPATATDTAAVTESHPPTTNGSNGATSSLSAESDYLPMLSAEKGSGMNVMGILRNVDDSLFMELKIENTTSAAMSGFAIQFNQNAFGLIPASKLNVTEPLQPFSSDNVLLPLKLGGQVDENKGPDIQLAMKCNPCGIVYMVYRASRDLDAFFLPDGKLDKPTFLRSWGAVSDEYQKNVTLRGNSEQELFANLERHKVFLVARRPGEGGSLYTAYFSVKMAGSGLIFLLELVATSPGNGKLAVRPTGAQGKKLMPAFLPVVDRLLSSAE